MVDKHRRLCDLERMENIKNVDWVRSETKKVTLRSQSYGGFHVELSWETDREGWDMSLIDYDDSCGATACFATEAEAMASFDEFLPLALRAYEEKHAKYGRMPVISRGLDGRLMVTLP